MQTGAAYIRVSTADQLELSPDAQIRLIQEYAKKNNIIISKQHIYIDEGISGRKAEKRPAFMQMISIAKTKPKPFDVILVHKFDRFSRSREDSIVYKSLLRKECDIQVISITEQMEDDKFSVILEAMLEAMAEYYSLNLAEEVTKGMTEKALRGGYQARPPLGYEIKHKGDTPVIVPEEAEIVKLIFSLFVTYNKSIYEISKHLNSMGLRTSRNKPFEKRSIQYILENPMYIGFVRWNRKHNSTNIIKDESEWIITEGKHESIIEKELFYAAADKIKSESKPRGARPTASQKHWLSGLLKCSNCGRTLVASSKIDKKSNIVYWNFQCYGYHKGKCLVSHQISEKKVVNSLIKELKDFLKDTNSAFEVKTIEKIDNDIRLLELQLHNLNQRTLRMKESYLAGIDSLDEYRENRIILEKERTNLQNKIDEINNQPEDPNLKNKMNLRVQNVLDIITDANISYVDKSDAMKSIIEKIIYDKTALHLSFYYYYLYK